MLALGLQDNPLELDEGYCHEITVGTHDQERPVAHPRKRLNVTLPALA